MTLEERLEKIELLLVSLIERERIREFTPSKNSHGSSDVRSSRAANGADMAASVRRKKESGEGPTPRGQSATQSCCDSRRRGCCRSGGLRRDRRGAARRCGGLDRR